MNRREFFLANIVGAALHGVCAAWPSFRATLDGVHEGAAPDPDYPVGHVRRYGAAGNGKTDDTEAFARAMREISLAGGGNVIADKGTYLINADFGAGKGIRLASNCTLQLSSDATLQARSNALPNSAIVWMKEVTNAHVVGGAIRGERNDHAGTTGEWGMGILMQSAHNCSVRGTTVSDCWGDGIYVGSTRPVAGTESTGILLDDVTCDNNRRQGVSVVAAKDVHIQNSRFTRTHGTRPAAGVDFETNRGTAVIADCVVTGCTFDDNEIGVVQTGQCTRVSIVRNTFNGNRSIGVYLANNVQEAIVDRNVIAQSNKASTGIRLRGVGGAKVTNNTIKGVFAKDISETAGMRNQIDANRTLKE